MSRSLQTLDKEQRYQPLAIDSH